MEMEMVKSIKALRIRWIFQQDDCVMTGKSAPFLWPRDFNTCPWGQVECLEVQKNYKNCVITHECKKEGQEGTRGKELHVANSFMLQLIEEHGMRFVGAGNEGGGVVLLA